MRNYIYRIAQALLVSLAVLAMGSASAQAETVRIITTGKGSALEWPLYIGVSKGFFKSRDIDIDLFSTSSTAMVMQQVTGGSGDLGTGGLTDPIRAIDQGAGLSLLTLETLVPPYSLWGKQDVKDIAGLKGKMVIVGGAKDVTRIFFERMAVPNGLNDGDYDLTYAGTTPARYAALQSGAVDAAILYPPASFAASAAGFSKLGELADYVKDMPFTGYAANVEWAKAHPALVTSFLEGLHEGVAWFYDKANREEAIDILVAESGAKRPDVEKTYDYYMALHIFPDKATMTPEALASTVKVLGDAGELKGAADPKRFIDDTVNAMLP
ncbi:ABC transporter substrate-binding protein [Hartmannibacter diazotrophicus]|uniref:ABC transporter substrate-binding protein n=1 Tax=Hartmannibacter diazotrophicus TaxID=1482074 RepID=UPI0012FD25BB|nr:ABC transporter substrate-binding protein [Hartmannibacter diazotrophicus]